MTEQPQREYIITEEQLSKIEKRYIPGEYGLRITKDIRNHPHTPVPLCEAQQCRDVINAHRAEAARARDEVLDDYAAWEFTRYTYNRVTEYKESLRSTAQEHP